MKIRVGEPVIYLSPSGERHRARLLDVTKDALGRPAAHIQMIGARRMLVLISDLRAPAGPTAHR